MNIFWKTATLVLITVVLCNAVSKQERDIAVLVSMVACCMAAMAAASFLEPVLDNFISYLFLVYSIHVIFLHNYLKQASNE